MHLPSIRVALRSLADPRQAAILRRFFKTGPGEYGEGDRFYGIKVPVLRTLSKQFDSIPVSTLRQLLRSSMHEERMLGLLIMVRRYARGDVRGRQRVFDLYLAHTRCVNNWDLVDLSAPSIVGVHLTDRDRGLLCELASSDNLWERRIAIIATLHFIRRREFADTLAITRQLLGDREDLIHKAAGWMLREVGKRDLRAEEEFLGRHHRHMPRTMLRYAIERFPERKRQRYLR